MIYQKVESHFANVNPRRFVSFLILFICVVLSINNGYANDAEIVDVQANCSDQVCTFEVTIKHNDTGWDHYADGWRVLTGDNKELGNRVLFHPHVNEQPFTRSLNGVEIPKDINTVWIESHDPVHGANPEKFKVDL